MKRGASLAAPVLLVVCACVFAASAPAPKPTPLPRDSVYQLPVRMTAQTGRSFAWSARRGRPQLVAMFYTSCQYICPLIVDAAKGVERQLTPTQRQRLGILLISVDPKRDTPAVLRVIMDKRGLDPVRWTLARPAAGDVRSIAGVLGTRYRALADGEFNHTSALVLLDAQGRILARTEQMGSRPDPAFIASVQRATSATLTPIAARPVPRQLHRLDLRRLHASPTIRRLRP